MLSKKTMKILSSSACAAIAAAIYILCKLLVHVIMPPAFPEYYTFWDAGDTVWTIVYAAGGFFFGQIIYLAVFSNMVQTKFKAIGKFDAPNNTLLIYKRSPYFKDFITVEPVLILDHTYNDPTLVYTGATVGGVSMGGFHMEGGDYDAHLSRSGRFRLVHIDPITDTRTPIEKIDMHPSLVKSAQDDPVIRKFLKDGTLVLFYNEDLNQSMAMLAQRSAASGDMATALSAAQRAHMNKQLTKEDCNYVKEWLFGNK